ncbi:hypothetical protein [Inquilinus sp.]|uniref:hypothetical protein n=1 Tax=Inquilinus sp. TaxID=1932117 RepID=UPI003F67373B
MSGDRTSHLLALSRRFVQFTRAWRQEADAALAPLGPAATLGSQGGRITTLRLLKHSLFSAQSFAAGALALDVAFSLDMARPCRSVATVCITTQTFASTVCAKVIWRLP